MLDRAKGQRDKQMLQKDIEQEFRVMKRIPEINWFRVRLSCFSRAKWADKYERMV